MCCSLQKSGLEMRYVSRHSKACIPQQAFVTAPRGDCAATLHQTWSVRCIHSWCTKPEGAACCCSNTSLPILQTVPTLMGHFECLPDAISTGSISLAGLMRSVPPTGTSWHTGSAAAAPSGPDLQSFWEAQWFPLFIQFVPANTKWKLEKHKMCSHGHYWGMSSQHVQAPSLKEFITKPHLLKFLYHLCLHIILIQPYLNDIQ